MISIEARGRVDEAEHAFRRAVELWPEWPEAQGMVLLADRVRT